MAVNLRSLLRRAALRPARKNFRRGARRGKSSRGRSFRVALARTERRAVIRRGVANQTFRICPSDDDGSKRVHARPSAPERRRSTPRDASDARRSRRGRRRGSRDDAGRARDAGGGESTGRAARRERAGAANRARRHGGVRAAADRGEECGIHDAELRGVRAVWSGVLVGKRAERGAAEFDSDASKRAANDG